MSTPSRGIGVPLSSNRELQVIPDTKVIPPRGARHLISRLSLMNKLMEARRQRCVMLQGPAGSGKTSALLAWRRELLGLNYDVAWLSLTAEDNEPIRLSHCILASLAEIDTGMVRESALLLSQDCEELSLEHWVIALIQEISLRQRELVLMLDDVHHLQDLRIIQTLGWLLDYAPPQLHLVFGSRAQLPSSLPLARLRTKGLLAEFDLRDLRFSAEESERFLREQLGDIDKRDAEELHELTDGWAAGLQLFAIDLKSRRGRNYNRVQIRDASAFASFFEQEVLTHLLPQDLQLLTQASMCNRFCAALCANLLGKPQAIPRMLNQLSRLDNENLFITQVQSHHQQTWYRLHPLLREVLRERLNTQSEDELKRLHAKARDWFFTEGHMDEAVRHAVQAGDAQAAADIVEACANDLIARGSISQLPSLLRKLPLEEIPERYGLQLVMAQLQLYSHKFGEAQSIIEHLQEQHDHLSLPERWALLVLRGALAMQLDDSEGAWAIKQDLQAIPASADDLTLTGRATILAWLLTFEGHFEQARLLLDDHDCPSTSPRRTLVGRCIYGITLNLQGRISEAEHIFRTALLDAEQQGEATVSAACTAASMLASTLYEQNNFEHALDILQPKLDVVERVSLPGVVTQSLLVQGTIFWLRGHRLEAQGTLERMEVHARKYQLHRMLAWALYTRLRWHLQSNQSVQAEHVLEQMIGLADTNSTVSRGAPQMVNLLAARARVEMHLYRKEFASAVTLLLPLIPLLESEQRWPQATHLRLQLAIAERGCGHEQLARKQFLEALGQGHRLGLVRTLLDVSPQIPEILKSLLEQEGLDPVLSFYVKRLLIAASPAQKASTPEKAMPMETLSERETEVLQLMAQAMTNKKIARILNVSPETVKWHLKNVFAKLGVTARDEAIAKWRDMTIEQPAERP